MADVTSPFGFPYPESTDLVRDGATDIEALAEGVNDQFLAGFQFVGTRYYTSSGTFAKADPFGNGSFPGAKLRAIRVRVQGAGGGGGGAATTTAGQYAVGNSGASGAFSESFITNIAGLAASVTVTRGAGGAGGGPGNAAGSAGGNSSFGTAVVANGSEGGSGGVATVPSVTNLFTSNNANGASSGTGDLAIPGEGSMPNYILALGNLVFPPMPGSSIFGRTRVINPLSGANGETQNTNAFGVGGIGGVNGPSQATGRSGSAGVRGIVIVDVFA